MDSRFRGNDAIAIAGVAATTIIPAPRFREDRLRGNDAIAIAVVAATTIIPTPRFREDRLRGNDAIDHAEVAATTVIPAEAGIHWLCGESSSVIASTEHTDASGSKSVGGLRALRRSSG